MIAFAMPKQLRSFMRKHRRPAYNVLLSGSSGAMKRLACDKTGMKGSRLGFFRSACGSALDD